MKTAFCFSGELRSIDKIFFILKEKVLNMFTDYDIFYYTWNDDPDIHKLHYLENDAHIKDVLIEDRICVTEHPRYSQTKRQEVSVQGLLRQLYCLKKCNELKYKYENKNNFEYDIVVRIRPDILVVNNTSLEKTIENWNMKNYVYTTDHDDHHGYNDRFYFSNSENMNFLCNRLDLLDYYIDLGGRFHYETFLKFCILYKNLNISRSKMEFVLLRNNGDLSGELNDNKLINI